MVGGALRIVGVGGVHRHVCPRLQVPNKQLIIAHREAKASIPISGSL
jgi:hypothetical protein